MVAVELFAVAPESFKSVGSQPPKMTRLTHVKRTDLYALNCTNIALERPEKQTGQWLEGFPRGVPPTSFGGFLRHHAGVPPTSPKNRLAMMCIYERRN